MNRCNFFAVPCLLLTLIAGATVCGQDKDKKVKNIFYGKVVEVGTDKVVVEFDSDWNKKKMEQKHTFDAEKIHVLIVNQTKGMGKDETKLAIEELKGKVVSGKEGAKTLSPGMRIMCPIYNGGPPEKDAVIVISGKKKGKLD